VWGGGFDEQCFDEYMRLLLCDMRDDRFLLCSNNVAILQTRRRPCLQINPVVCLYACVWMCRPAGVR
jgi:hypothetical protein